jgi:stress response protein SCP2
MSISLQKGQKISLTKESSSLNKLMIGLGWDQIKPAKKGFFSAKPADIDCDASVIMLQDGKFLNMQDLIYFGNLKHSSGAVQHMGDNLTGAGDGDDEQVLVDLNKVPVSYDRLVLVVNIYSAVQRKQHFGLIENAFIRLVNHETNQEMCRYDLKENYNDMLSLIFGEVYRHNGEWKFNPMGQATLDPGLKELVQRYV